MDREKVIKGLENTEIMLKQAVDRGGEMAVMGAFKCYNHVSDTLALLKEQEQMYYALEHDWKMCRKMLKEQEERIKSLEHQLETITKWRANTGAFD